MDSNSDLDLEAPPKLCPPVMPQSIVFGDSDSSTQYMYVCDLVQEGATPLLVENNIVIMTWVCTNNYSVAVAYFSRVVTSTYV